MALRKWKSHRFPFWKALLNFSLYIVAISYSSLVFVFKRWLLKTIFFVPVSAFSQIADLLFCENRFRKRFILATGKVCKVSAVTSDPCSHFCIFNLKNTVQHCKKLHTLSLFLQALIFLVSILTMASPIQKFCIEHCKFCLTLEIMKYQLAIWFTGLIELKRFPLPPVYSGSNFFDFFVWSITFSLKKYFMFSHDRSGGKKDHTKQKFGEKKKKSCCEIGNFHQGEGERKKRSKKRTPDGWM